MDLHVGLCRLARIIFEKLFDIIITKSFSLGLGLTDEQLLAGIMHKKCIILGLHSLTIFFEGESDQMQA